MDAQRRISSARKLKQERYLDDPVAWAHDCIDWSRVKVDRPGTAAGLAPYQEEVLGNLPDKRRIAVRSPHGAAKSATASMAVLWFAVTREGAGADWKVPTTAGRWHQLVHFLWPEIHKWARLLRWDKIGREPFRSGGELMKRELHLRHGMAFAMAVGDPNALEGAHADELLYVFDEAKIIPDPFFDAAEGAFSTAGKTAGTNAYALALSVPGEPLGRFYEICARQRGTENWWARWITADEAVLSGRMTSEWVDQRRLQWGEDSALFKNRCLGQFASAEKDGVIPLAWVEAANARWMALFGKRLESTNTRRDEELGTPAIMGLDEPLDVISHDVARAGGDKNVWALRQGNAILELRRDGFTDNLVILANKGGAIQDQHGGRAVVDADGVGAGVYDVMRTEGREVVPFHAAAATKRRDATGEIGFVNVRAAAWWNMREMLDPESGCDVALPIDDHLTGDLVTPRKREVSGSRIQVESKDDIQKRLHRSTDDGDAVVVAFWVNAGGSSYAEMYAEIAAMERGEKPKEEEPEPDEDARARASTAPPRLVPKPKPRSGGGWGSIYAKDEEPKPGLPPR